MGNNTNKHHKLIKHNKHTHNTKVTKHQSQNHSRPHLLSVSTSDENMESNKYLTPRSCDILATQPKPWRRKKIYPMKLVESHEAYAVSNHNQRSREV